MSIVSITKKSSLSVLISVFLLISPAQAENKSIMPANQSNLIVLDSKSGFSETVDSLKKSLNSKGLTIFTEIDHSAAAKTVGLAMQPTKVIIFGNPKGGTPLMNKLPALALQLPLKVLIAEDTNGNTKVSFFKASFLAESVGGEASLTENLSKVEKLIAKVVMDK